MGRENVEEDGGAPLSYPKRGAPEQEAANLISFAESSTSPPTSGTPKTTRRLPGAQASNARDIAQPKRLAIAKGVSSVPSIRSLNESSSMHHSSPSIDSSKNSCRTSRTQSTGSSIHTGVHPGAQSVAGITHEDQAMEQNHQRGRIFDVNQSTDPDMTPIAAEVASDSTIIARVSALENRLRQELLNNGTPTQTVHAEKVVNETHGKNRKRIFWIVAIGLTLLVITGVVWPIVTLTNKRDSASFIPTSSPTNEITLDSPSARAFPCTLCVDGSQPDLEAEITPGFSCGDLQEDLAQIDDPNDLACLSGQATGWFACSCPTLPQRPSESVCSSVCQVDSRPPAFDSQLCIDFDIYVELAGVEADDCASLIAQTPTDCVCTMELDQLRLMLGTMSTAEALLDTSTPQYKAMVWLANEDPASLDITASQSADVQNRYLGALLWYSLGGEGWFNQFNFLSADDVCDWNDGTRGLICSQSSGTILTISLESNNLVGTLPGLEISAFQTLETLQLHENDIKGSIPSTINNIASLTSFSIYDNKSLGGTLPASLFELRQLELLHLGIHSLSGSIPSNIGEATALTSLSMAFADLTGTIPTSLSRLTWLRNLIIIKTSLSGSLPALSSMRRLELVYLHNNLLNGTIPDHYGQSPTIKTLNIGVNDLTGNVPDFSACRSLQELDLQGNRLTGNLERFFNTTPKALLNNIVLRENQLTGTLPTSIGLFSNLAELSLRDNRALSGPLPTELGALGSLEDLNLSNCKLSGEIPSEMGDLSALASLDLSTNELKGTIPSQLGNLQNLVQANLADNLLSGTVPSVLAALPKLASLHVQKNQLTGSLDSFCDGGFESLEADCANPAEITCDCCSSCC